MIWLTGEQLQLVDAHPSVKAAQKLAKTLAERARDFGTAEAIHASARANEAEYWLTLDLAHQMAQIDGRPDAST